MIWDGAISSVPWPLLPREGAKVHILDHHKSDQNFLEPEKRVDLEAALELSKSGKPFRG